MSILVVSQFPKASELNLGLYDRVCENLQTNVVAHASSHNIGARRTDWNLHEQKIKEIDELTSWIQQMLPEVSKKFAGKEDVLIENERKYGGGGGMCGYNVNSFEIAECWGIHYNKSESVVEHNHFPYALSFVYYVRTPKGTGPIIIENETCDVKEGHCVFFLATQYHGVGSNKCDGRCAIVGNILYRF